MNFRRGQKVVCAKASRDLIKGKIYTIQSCIGDEAVTIEEIIPTDGCIGFWKWRFKPVDDEWADGILNKIIEEKNANELQWATEKVFLNIDNNRSTINIFK
jgi:hypothetical protein